MFSLDPPGDPAGNMAADEEAARRVRRGAVPAALRIYGWDRPAVSLGRRQNIEEVLDLVPGTQLPVVRRPTGGGAVVHRLDELTYALALPRLHAARGLAGEIHRLLRDELIVRGGIRPEELSVAGCDSGGPYTFCFQAPVCGDLLYRTRKVAGSALRVWRDGLLVQGAIQGLPVERPLLAEALQGVVRRLLAEETVPPE